MKIKIKKLHRDAKIPTHGSDFAAGWDLYAAHYATIHGGETAVIGTGISIEIPEGHFGAIYARSGLATKKGLRPANCVGVIDSDYRGEIKVAVHNDNPPVVIDEVPVSGSGHSRVFRMQAAPSDSSIKEVEVGDRIAQLVIQKYEDIEFEEVEELADSERGEGGFGSTGTN